jgi:hypothetical protein
MNILFPGRNNNHILNPFTSLIRLCLLPYIDIGTKLCISNSRIYYQYPSIFQGILRWKNGDKHYDLHNLYNSIIKSLEWYNVCDENIIKIFKMTIVGLEQLKCSYINTLLIQHSISHYIDTINSNLNSNSNTTIVKSIKILKKDVDTLTNLEQQLRDIWSNNEIDVIHNLLLLLESTEKPGYIVNAIIIILDGKDSDTQTLIMQHTTSL